MDDGPYKISGIHSFDTNALTKLTTLFETTYSGREISNPDYLRWEYADNPAGKAIIFVAEDEERFVSQYAVLPREFSINNSIIAGSLSVNTITHPSYRRKGLFPKLTQRTFDACREKRIHFTIGFPNRQSHPVIREKKLFSTPGYLPLLVRILNPFKSISGYMTSRSMKSGEEINLEFNQSNFPEGISNLDLLNDSRAHNLFLNVINTEKINLSNRSFEFLKWRYEDIPLRKYYLFGESEGEKIISEAVFRAKHIFGMRCGILVDFVCRADSGSDSKMMKFINEMARHNKLDIVITTAPEESREKKFMESAGFFSLPNFILPQRLAFIFQSHDESSNRESNFKNWFLTFGDYDIF